jgi:predicted dehydrogenase
MMTPLRVGLIGAGTAGMRHANAIRRTTEAVIAGIADPAPAAAEAAASLQVRCWSDYERMLAEADLEAVVISLPHGLLAEAALTCARYRKHILLEKPMAIAVSDAKAVARACDDAGVCLMVNFVHRYRAELRQARASVLSGALGRVIVLVDVMASGQGPVPDWIWQRDRSGGGIMMYNGVHSVDRLIWLAGAQPVEVTAAMDTLVYPVEVEDNLVGTIRFSTGALAVIVQHKSQAANTLGNWETTIYGTTGALKVVTGTGLRVMAEKEQVNLAVERDDRFLGAWLEFLAAIRENRAPTASGQDGVQALETVLALYESAETGKCVKLAQSTVAR